MTVRVAVIGAGRWGRNLVRVLHRLGALHTVCDLEAGARDAVVRMYPDVRVVQKVDDVLADREVSAIVVALPAQLHHAVARRALRAGKDVLVEKPLALSTREGRDLVSLARRRRAVLMVGHILNYHPGFTRLQAIVRSGELGDVLYIYSNRLNLGQVRREENILWSFAPHDISAILSLVGALPITVSATGRAYLQPAVVDVTVTNLTFAGGVRAHVFVSWLHPFKEQRLVVVGARKMAVFDDMLSEAKLKIYDKGIEWTDGMPVPREAPARIIDVAGDEPLEEECRHFLECAMSRATPRTDGGSAVDVLAVLEASQRSLARDGHPVKIRRRGGASRA